MLDRRVLLLAGTLALAAPAQAGEAVPYELALSRLRACVTAGSAGAPRESLQAAVIAVRSLCRPQINRAYEASDRRVAAANPRAKAAQLSELRQAARRTIDYDLAILVSTATGQPH
jgi:hypothetical protein